MLSSEMIKALDYHMQKTITMSGFLSSTNILYGIIYHPIKNDANFTVKILGFSSLIWYCVQFTRFSAILPDIEGWRSSSITNCMLRVTYRTGWQLHPPALPSHGQTPSSKKMQYIYNFIFTYICKYVICTKITHFELVYRLNISWTTVQPK